MTLGKPPLHGIRVVDLTSVIMGPLGTRILADFGADVIKVESDVGDVVRHYRPARNEDMSGLFLNLNRNKRSVIFDLKTDQGRQQLQTLITTADVFVHSMRPQAIARLGFDYESVRQLKPDIVYCGAYGFGIGGPYSGKAAYDDLIQAGSGMAALAASTRGEPAYLPTVICDKLAGQAIAYSVLAAIVQRFRDGHGQAIEVPMFESSVDFVLIEHMSGLTFVPALGPPGWARVLSPSRKPFKTSDGYACILPYSDRNWRQFLEFIGRPDLVGDPRLESVGSRVQHVEFLYGLIELEAIKRSTADWVRFCDEVSIPCMPVLNIAELAEDPHLRAVGLFQGAQHPTEGAYRFTRPPVQLSGSTFELRHHAPGLGQHTQDILMELTSSAGRLSG